MNDKCMFVISLFAGIIVGNLIVYFYKRYHT